MTKLNLTQIAIVPILSSSRIIYSGTVLSETYWPVFLLNYFLMIRPVFSNLYFWQTGQVTTRKKKNKQTDRLLIYLMSRFLKMTIQTRQFPAIAAKSGTKTTIPTGTKPYPVLNANIWKQPKKSRKMNKKIQETNKLIANNKKEHFMLMWWW